MDTSQFRTAAHAAVDEIADYFDNLPSRRVTADVEPGYLAGLIPKEPPKEGEDWSTSIAPSLPSLIEPGLTHWHHPNFMAFFPIGLSYPSILGELYSAAYSAPGFNWECSPVMTELETIVMGWVARAMHLPELFYGSGGQGGSIPGAAGTEIEATGKVNGGDDRGESVNGAAKWREAQGGGVIQGTASESLLTCMVCARERYIARAVAGLGQGQEREEKEAWLRGGRMIALASEQCHSSAEKAARVAGVKYRSVPVKWEDDLGMRGQAVEKTIQECESEGLEVFFVVATVGTTATCATDRVGEVLKIIQQREKRLQNGSLMDDGAERGESRVWVHVDAAYAGATFILPEYAHLAQQLEGVDSVTINLHKWLLVNFDCSTLFVKNKNDLTDVLSLTPSYLRNERSEKGLVTDYRDWQIPLGRRFRSLKIWFVMRAYGVEGMRQHLRKHIELGEKFAKWVGGRSDLFRIVTPPAFALTVFTVLPPNGGSLNEGNAITAEVCKRINASGDLFLTTSVVKGVTTIRVVSANMHTNEDSLRNAFDLIIRTSEKVRAAPLVNGYSFH